MWEYNQLSEQNDYLQHYGVLGMKWGRRKGTIRSAKAKAAKKHDKLKKRADKAANRSEHATMKYKARASMRNRSDIAQAKLESARSNAYRKQAYATKTKRALEKWDNKTESILGDEALRSYSAGKNSKALYKTAKKKTGSRKAAKAEVAAAKKSNPKKYATTKDKQQAAKKRERDAIKRERDRVKSKKKKR